ncbi:hypothetical protein GCM10010298_73150 [Streptomyces microflavus]|nr:hypothetical protein GCM10010298_73150 [Streptomyces microflavus]
MGRRMAEAGKRELSASTGLCATCDQEGEGRSQAGGQENRAPQRGVVRGSGGEDPANAHQGAGSTCCECCLGRAACGHLAQGDGYSVATVAAYRPVVGQHFQ